MKRRISNFFTKHPVVNFIAIVLFFVLIEGLFSFCSSKDSENSRMCPAFNDPTFETWFPYTTGQTLYFASSSGAKDTMEISSIEKSPAVFSSSAYPCQSDARFTSRQLNATGQYDFTAAYSVTEGRQRKELNLKVYDFILPGSWLKENEIYTDPPFSHRFLTSITLEGKEFTNVAELRRDTSTNKQAGVYKIWIAKQRGLVAYEYYPTMERFVKN